MGVTSRPSPPEVPIRWRRAIGFGGNSDGQRHVPALPVGLTYTAVAAGGTHSLALRSDGRAIGFGSNASGQLDVPPLPPGVTYTAVAAGPGPHPSSGHSVLLRSDGRVVAFGEEAFGNLRGAGLAAGRQIHRGRRWIGPFAGVALRRAGHRVRQPTRRRTAVPCPGASAPNLRDQTASRSNRPRCDRHGMRVGSPARHARTRQYRRSGSWAIRQTATPRLLHPLRSSDTRSRQPIVRRRSPLPGHGLPPPASSGTSRNTESPPSCDDSSLAEPRSTIGCCGSASGWCTFMPLSPAGWIAEADAVADRLSRVPMDHPLAAAFRRRWPAATSPAPEAGSAKPGRPRPDSSRWGSPPYRSRVAALAMGGDHAKARALMHSDPHPDSVPLPFRTDAAVADAWVCAATGPRAKHSMSCTRTHEAHRKRMGCPRER